MPPPSMRCLVTGGAGFIGSHICERLLRKGHSVRVLDDFSTGKRENLAALGPRIEILEGDLRNRKDLSRGLREIDWIFHQAALPSVQRSIEDPETTSAINAQGTLRLLEEAARAGAKRLVYASSSAVYGNLPGLPKRETDPLDPCSPYAESKLEGERHCLDFHKRGKIETVILRYFNIFGPRQDPKSPYAAVIPRFIQAIRQGTSPAIYGDGQQSRDFCYVENVAAANELAAVSPGAVGGCYNIACGQTISILDLLRTIEQLAGAKVPPRHEPSRPGEVRHSRASIETAQKDLGYRPEIDLREGLRRTLDYPGTP
jgi:UDP-glucose 4-epimerase